MQFSLRQLLIAFVSCSVLMGLVAIDVDFAIYVIVCLLPIIGIYAAYWWNREPELRVHRWKKPLLLGWMALGAAAACNVVDFASWGQRFGLYKALWIVQTTVITVLAVCGILALLVATPLRAWIPARDPSPRTRKWIFRLSWMAFLLGPVSYAVAWSLIVNDLLEPIVESLFNADKGLSVGILVWTLIVVAGVHLLAAVSFAIALLMQIVTAQWAKCPTLLNFLYCVAWLVYGVYQDYF